MYTPIFKKGEGLYIILDPSYVTKVKEEAILLGIAGQFVILDLNYIFTGEYFILKEVSEFYQVKETLPYTGAIIDLGLIGGEDFELVKSGKPIKDSVAFSSSTFFENNIFIVEIIEMNDKSNMTVAIGYEKGTYDPYVLLMGMSEEEALSPDKAREVATHMIYAAEASTMDSFIRRALDTAYGDDEMSSDKKDQLIDAIRNLREQERAANEKDSVEDDDQFITEEGLEEKTDEDNNDAVSVNNEETEKIESK